MVDFKPPVNVNYAAVVVRIRALVPLAGLDNLVAAPLLGYQAIVSKDTQVGDFGILFVAETQLSEEYARLNNLHRHSNLNDDESAKGYLEDNRRVKAIKLRGHRSDALFMPLTSLLYLEDDKNRLHLFEFKEGDAFDVLNGHEICRKYTRPTRGRMAAQQTAKESRVDKRFMPEHFDTENYFRNVDKLKFGELCYITQKLHGTSIRIGHTIVSRKLSWWEKLAKKVGVKVQETEYDYVYGSRKVIKDPNNPEQNHFYGVDLWTMEGERLKGLLPKGFIVYGELIGWTPDNAPIQKGYTYGIPEGGRGLYVYRVTYVNPEGRQTDLSWDQVKEFCTAHGLNHVPELSKFWANEWMTEHIIPDYLDVRLADEYPQALPVNKGMVDEGVCIRRDGLTPLILKAKSPIFLQHETKMLDQEEVVDIEES